VRVGQLSRNVEREAVGRYDVETGARQKHHAGASCVGVARQSALEDRDFSADVEIVRPRRQARVDHRLGRATEWPGAMQDDFDACQPRDQRFRIVEPEDPMLEAVPIGDRPNTLRAATGDDRLLLALRRESRCELTRVAVCPIDQERASHRLRLLSRARFTGAAPAKRHTTPVGATKINFDP
jgi:hypothetical protein